MPDLRQVLIATAVAALLAAGWTMRGYVADADIAAIHKELADAREAHRRYIDEVATKRKDDAEAHRKQIDEIEANRKADIRYVDREVIRYVTTPRPSCPVDPDWVCAYNRALGLPCAAQAGD